MTLLKVMNAKINNFLKQFKKNKKTPTIVIYVENNKDTIVSVNIEIYQAFKLQRSTKLILTYFFNKFKLGNSWYTVYSYW